MTLKTFLRGGKPSDPQTPAPGAREQVGVRAAEGPNLLLADPTDAEETIREITHRLTGVVDSLADETEKRFGEVDTHLCTELQNEASALRQSVAQIIEETTRRYSLPGSEESETGKRVNVAVIANYLVTGAWGTNSDFEREIHANMRGVRVPGIHDTEVEGAEQYATRADPDSSVGYFIPVQQSTDWIDKLRAQAIVAGLGATQLSSPNAIGFDIPRIVTDSRALWGGEKMTIVRTDLASGNLHMHARGLRAATAVSNTALQFATQPMDQLIRMNHEEQLALGMDLAALNGDGTTQPRGIIQSTGVGTVDFPAQFDKMIYSKAQEFPHTLRLANALRGSLGWALEPSTLLDAQLAGDEGAVGDGHVSIARKMMTEGALTNLAGYPFATTTQLPSAAIAVSGGTLGNAIFGAWQDLLITTFLGVTVDVFRGGQTLALEDETLVRTIMKADVGLRQVKSFVLSSAYNNSV